MSIGTNIKNFRTMREMSMQELADKVGVSRVCIHKYESGKTTNIPIERIQDIAKALNVSVFSIINWEDDESLRLKEELNTLFNMMNTEQRQTYVSLGRALLGTNK